MRSPMFRPLCLALVLALSVTMVLSGCGGAAQPKQDAKPAAAPPAPKKTLVIGYDTGIMISSDPAVAYEGASCFISHNCYDTLVAFKGADVSKVIPGLSKEWSFNDAGTEYTFKLREAKFASGNPVTADDVVYSFDRVISMNDTPAWLLTQTGLKVGGTKAIDKTTVKITLPAPFNPQAFLSCLAFTVGGIVEKAIVEKNAKNNDWGKAWLIDHTAGSGPYVMEKWEREAQIIVTSNPHYWAGKPDVERVLLKHISESANQMMQLEKGEIDIAMNLNSDQIAKLKTHKDIQVIHGLSTDIYYLGLNAGIKPFTDVRVREAVKWAVDYEGLVKHVIMGNAAVTQTWLPKGFAGYEDSLPYKRDIAKAKALLAQAGLSKGFDTELLVSSGSVAGVPGKDVAAKIQSDLAEAGIRVKIREMVAAEMYTIYRAQKAQMIVAAWSPDYADPDANAKPFMNHRAKQLAWRLQWYPNDLADMAEKAAALSNWEKRAPIYHEMSVRFQKESPFVTMFQPMTSYGVKKSIQGFESLPFGTAWLFAVKKN